MAVYFIRDGHGHIKIGYSRDPSCRLRALQSARSDVVELLRVVEGTHAVEHWFHRHFAAHRIRGEWFRFHPDMLTVNVPDVILPFRIEVTPVQLPVVADDPPVPEPMDHDEFLRWLAQRVRQYPTQQTCAVSIGVSPGYLSDVMNGRRPPSRKLLAALKLREVLVYLVPDDETDDIKVES